MFNKTKKTNKYAAELIEHLRTLEKGVDVRILTFDGKRLAGLAIGVSKDELSSFTLRASKHLMPMVIMVTSFDELDRANNLLATQAHAYHHPLMMVSEGTEELIKICRRNERKGIDLEILLDQLVIEGVH